MSRQYVNTLADGENIDEVYLLADKQLRANRNAETYLLTQLRNKTGQISGLMWNVREDVAAGVSQGDCVRVRGRVQLFQGNLQMILTHITSSTANGYDAKEFVPSSGADTELLQQTLRDILLAIEDESLRSLMECFLNDSRLMDELSRAPAGVRLHHACHGGLLEHVVNVLQTSQRIRDLYPKIDFDLLAAGIFLHDIGKTRELSYDSTFSYTDEGQLIGHLVQGVEILNEKVTRLESQTGQPFPRETWLRLKHMILSHHGSYEYGSPRLPMTLEAVALHYLDNLDAKVNEFLSLIQGDPNSESGWTPYNQNLQRKIFKGETGNI